MSATMNSVEFDTRKTQLLEMVNASWMTQAIRAACLLRIPDRLATGAATAAELASATDCHAPSLQRLLRALATLGLCSEDEQGRYAVTPSGELLCEAHAQSVRAWALLVGGSIWQRWAELDQSVRSGLSHRRRHGVENDFDDLAHSPAAAAQFYRAMVDITRSVAGPVARAIDPRGIQCVVDVGGGSGELLAQVLGANPTLRGVLFDLPQGLGGATAALEQAGVATRCACVAGSFFDTMPENGDLYLLKSVLHNWDDARCVQILKRCCAAMDRRGQVWVIERVMAERIGTTALDRAVARSDLNMLVALSGRERTAREFAALFDEAGLAMQTATTQVGEFHVLQAMRQ
jgi:hypothetical protein